MKAIAPIVREIESNLRKQYNDSSDDAASVLSNVQKFVYALHARSAGEQEILREAARLIYHNFGFKEVAIPLKSREDGKFRYEGFLGMTRDAEQGYRAIAYDYDIVFDDDTYPGIRISKFTELMLAELEPYEDGEENTYNRPLMLNAQRKSAGEMVEGDYYAVYIHAAGDEIIGWLELSSSKDGKFPSGRTIKGLELLASLLGVMLSPWRGGSKKGMTAKAK